MENILIGLTIAAGSLLMGIGVRKMIKTHNSRKVQRLKLDQYDPAQCILHSKTLNDVADGQLDIRRGMEVIVPCVFALMAQANGGKLNGEFDIASKAINKYKTYRPEFDTSKK